MSTRNRLLLAAACLLITGSASAAPLPILKPGSAMIENSGSTNTLGYTIYVSPKGEMLFAKVGFPMTSETHFDTASLSKAQTHTLFQHLSDAGPLASLPARHGMRSASFGTATFITYKCQRSPDLTYPANAQARALNSDIRAIALAMHLGGPRHPILRPSIP